MEVWFDKWDIGVGESITWKIENGIRKNEYLGIIQLLRHHGRQLKKIVMVKRSVMHRRCYLVVTIVNICFTAP